MLNRDADWARRGQTLPFIAILIGVLLGFAGLAVDVGYLRYQQRIQQNATDSAALAGATELLYGTDYQKAAKADAAANGFADGVNGITIAAVNPPSTGRYVSDTGAVQVTISGARPTFFMRVFGRTSATVTTSAVASASAANNPDCVYLLQSGGNANFNGSTINAPNCGFAINSAGPNMRGASIDAASISYGGSAPNINSASFAKATPAPAVPASDPCMQIPGCANLANNPPPVNPCAAPPVLNGFASPGCYTGWNAHGQTLTLNQGVYVLNNPNPTGPAVTFNFSNATLTGTGVTFYIGNNVQLNFDKAKLNLSAPASGPDAGMLFYQVPSNTNDPNFNKTASDSLTGVLYFPTSNVNFNKTGGGYVVLIFGGVNFNSNNMTFTGPDSGSSYIHEAVLVE